MNGFLVVRVFPQKSILQCGKPIILSFPQRIETGYPGKNHPTNPSSGNALLERLYLEAKKGYLARLGRCFGNFSNAAKEAVPPAPCVPLLVPSGRNVGSRISPNYPPEHRFLKVYPKYSSPQLLTGQRLATQNPKSPKNFLAFGPPHLL
jgi:hypothetical protein